MKSKRNRRDIGATLNRSESEIPPPPNPTLITKHPPQLLNLHNHRKCENLDFRESFEIFQITRNPSNRFVCVCRGCLAVAFALKKRPHPWKYILGRTLLNKHLNMCKTNPLKHSMKLSWSPGRCFFSLQSKTIRMFAHPNSTSVPLTIIIVH